MKRSIPFLKKSRKRDLFLKAPAAPQLVGVNRRVHSHTRGELPGRLARNFKAEVAAAATALRRS